MDPLLAIALLVVAALAAGAGGYLFGRRHGRSLERKQSRSAPQATLAAIDSLVGDSIGRLRGWLVGSSSSTDGRLQLAEDGTITLLFSDIAGSTALNHRLGDERFAEILRTHDEVVARTVNKHGGVVVKTQGDGFMAAFQDTSQAVLAALSLQEKLTEHRRIGERLRLRIGVHVGSAVTTDDDVFGAAVAFTARVASEAAAGSVFVSSDVRDRLEGTGVPVSFSSRLLPRRLKGVPGLHRLHSVTGA